MPSIDPAEKQAFIDIVYAAPYPGGPTEAARLEDILVDYSDIITAVNRQLPLFAANNAYLTQAMSVLNGNSLLLSNIWFNVGDFSPPLTNPVLIVNCTLTNVLLSTTSPPGEPSLTILGPSTIDYIILDAATTLDNIYIGPGAHVKTLDASASVGSPPTYARVNLTTLAFAKSTPSYLDNIVYGSSIGDVSVAQGSYYGGIKGDAPQNTCAATVTNLVVADITTNSVLVSWGAPVDDYLFINVFYRETNSSVWIPVTNADGQYTQEVGFVFRRLDRNTLYDFKVQVICVNGGYNESEISSQTVCCSDS